MKNLSVFSFLGLLLFSTVSAQVPVKENVSESQIQIIKTSSVFPVKIALFTPTLESPTSGLVFIDKNIQISKATLVIQGKEDEVLSEDLDISKRDESGIKFSFPLELEGEVSVRVEVFDYANNIIGRGQKDVFMTLPTKEREKTPEEFFATEIESARIAAELRIQEENDATEALAKLKVFQEEHKIDYTTLLVIPVLVVVGFLILLFIFEGKNTKKNLKILILVPFFLPSLAFAEMNWDWVHPIDTWVFSPDSSDTNFQSIRVEGRVYDEGIGVFTESGIEFRVKFTNTVTGEVKGEYDITAKITIFSSNHFGGDVLLAAPVDLTEGEWQVQVLFQKTISNPGIWYASDWTGVIVVDKTPPDLVFNYTPDYSGVGSSTTINTPTSVTITCTDTVAGCNVASFGVFDIYGNFCDAATEYDGTLGVEMCDTTGARGFEVCDKVGNCTDISLNKNKLEITWFDNIAPDIQDFILGIGGFFNENLKSSDSFTSEVTYEDPNEPLVGDVQVVDTNACGDTDFFENGGKCSENTIVCAASTSLRGTIDQTDQDAICLGICPDGYVEVDGFCLLECNYLYFDDSVDPVASMCFDFYVH